MNRSRRPLTAGALRESRLSGRNRPEIPGGVMNNRKTRAFSFEFFPPKGEQGAERLRDTIRHLEPLKPQYGSVTFGAGGSTKDGTYQTAQHIQKRTDLHVESTLSCHGV